VEIKQAFASNLAMSDFIVEAYLKDLTPQEMFARPCDGANHIAWQLGHLIGSEWWLMDKVAPGKMKPLPEGFAEQHKKPTACIDDASCFLSKEEYLKLAKDVRGQTLNVVESLTPADLSKPVTGVPPFLKTIGETILFVGPHWIMHAGQWAITRRKLGKPPLF
jgi:hypothetical protein